ncbi:hypothetical protein O6H91_07G008600 [Diphasiastrum complanatum]|nr:hypothetical protein O6H91_07G008600 [Diphasiastrum complanatum]
MAWECAEGVTCSRCGEKGHLQRNCRNINCHKCGRKGHISKYCNDPFAKAAEAEKLERQQAMFQARAIGSIGVTHAEISATSTCTGALGLAKAAPGPWDGLGYSKTVPLLEERKRGESTNLIDSESNRKSSNSTHSCSKNDVLRGVLLRSGSRKRTASVKVILAERVKVLGIKKKEVPRYKEPRLQTDSLPQDLSKKLESTDNSLIAEKAKGDSGRELEWHGLIGYESESSGSGVEGCPDSGDKRSENAVDARAREYQRMKDVQQEHPCPENEPFIL